MRSAVRLAGAVSLLLPLLSGCAGMPARAVSRCPPPDARAVVYILDGAGPRPNAIRAVPEAAEALRLPLDIRPFLWSHGPGGGLADVIDVAHARRQGGELAAEIRQSLASCPSLPVSIVGYSAGSAVALAAAERLPPNSLDRVVLIAPAVSACYDLRPALAAARGGIDAFTSERDRFWLGFGTGLFGTSDGKREPAAGRVGFRPPTDQCLVQRLRQHPWDPCIAWTGHEGGHSGGLRPAFLKAYVLPLLTPSGAAPPLAGAQVTTMRR